MKWKVQFLRGWEGQLLGFYRSIWHVGFIVFCIMIFSVPGCFFLSTWDINSPHFLLVSLNVPLITFFFFSTVLLLWLRSQTPHYHWQSFVFSKDIKWKHLFYVICCFINKIKGSFWLKQKAITSVTLKEEKERNATRVKKCVNLI